MSDLRALRGKNSLREQAEKIGVSHVCLWLAEKNGVGAGGKAGLIKKFYRLPLPALRELRGEVPLRAQAKKIGVSYKYLQLAEKGLCGGGLKLERIENFYGLPRGSVPRRKIFAKGLYLKMIKLWNERHPVKSSNEG